MGSGKFKLNMDDLVKLGKNAALVGVAAGATYASANLTQVDLGSLGVFVVPVVTLFLQSLISWAKDNTK